MGKSVAIVSAGNDAYFPLLADLVVSIKSLNLPQDFHLKILDVGLSPQNRTTLEREGIELFVPNWFIQFPAGSEAPDWFRGTVARPFLPQCFPGHDLYIWLDADTWVQDRDCLLRMAGHDDVSIQIATTVFFEPIYISEQIINGQRVSYYLTPDARRQNIEECYRLNFGQEMARRAYETVINSGVFVLSAASPCWSVWADYLRIGMANGFHPLVEERALNLGILEGRIPHKLMPPRWNWDLGGRKPWVDIKRGCLIDPDAPAYPLGVVHLCDLKKIRSVPMRSLHGGMIDVPFYYRDFRQWTAHLK